MTTHAANVGSRNDKQPHYSTSIGDIENAFFNYAADKGVKFTERPIADGKLHRAHVEGDKPGTKNGAYILHPDGNPAGWFMHYPTGIKGNWTLSGKREPMTKAIRAEIDRESQRRRIIEQQARHEEAVKKAVYIWSRSTSVINHQYLTKKHVKPDGARLYGDTLVIPIYDENKQLVNLQFINADGTKRFLSGGRKKGCFSVIGKPDASGIIQICEGWATGSSLHEATGHFTIVALDAGNLKPVAQVIRRLYPSHEIIICGDNDKSGVGQEAARLAALACGGKFILPPIVGQDFNDMLTMEIGQ